MVDREGSPVPKYGAVLLETPVTSYTINLPDGTSLDEAKQVVLDEFPPGAIYAVFDDDERTCLIASIRSPEAQQSLRKHGYGNWVPIAAFGTSTATRTTLDPTNVTDVSLLPSQPTKNLGRC